MNGVIMERADKMAEAAVRHLQARLNGTAKPLDLALLYLQGTGLGRKNILEGLHKAYAETGKPLYLLYALDIVLAQFDLESACRLNWIYEGVADHLGKKTETVLTHHCLGLLVENLVRAGSSGNQARLAVADWTGASDTKVRNGHIDVRNLRKIFSESDAEFLSLPGQREALKDFVSAIPGAFPERYPKAHKAWQKFREDLFTAPPQPDREKRKVRFRKNQAENSCVI